MGGDVQVSSKLGHGATFTLYLPLEMAHAASVKAA
jgi:signal transduction histidine kinase